MKVSVKIDNQLFDVEIENLYTRPIIAVVDGQRFEVWPEVNPTVTTAPPAPAPAVPGPAASAGAASAPALTASDAKTVYAPIPGVIVAVSVSPGDMIEAGQELCVLEAMKMKNAIRAPRVGQIAAVRVSEGQHVKHHYPLVEYAE